MACVGLVRQVVLDTGNVDDVRSQLGGIAVIKWRDMDFGVPLGHVPHTMTRDRFRRFHQKWRKAVRRVVKG